MCLQAVKQNGEALEFVNNQTIGVCLEAVKQNGEALQFVKNQTNRKLCEEYLIELRLHKNEIWFNKVKTNKCFLFKSVLVKSVAPFLQSIN